jgi:glycosyltransferase involved in cell wall biosynthesis
MTDALRDAGLDALNLTAAPGVPWRSSEPPLEFESLTGLSGDCEVVFLQYNPFSYGRWGVAPWLPVQLRRLHRGSGVRVLVMVHEAFVAPLRSRHHLLRAAQRLQLRAILREADLAYCSTTSVLADVRSLDPMVEARHLAVGSNLPDRRGDRDSVRVRLGVEDDGIVVAAFGTNHPARMMDWVSAAANAVVRSGRPTTLLNLGAGAPAPDATEAAVRVISPGMLEEGELASLLAASDVFVAPFTDGISTRRTTIMAALQHEIAVVGTRGPNTDAVFERSPDAVLLVDGGVQDAFADAVARLVDDADGRARRARAGRRLFDQHFAWPVIGRTVAEDLAGIPGRRR